MINVRSLSLPAFSNMANALVQGRAGRIALLALTLALGLLYVLQMNLTATKGYDIRALEQRRETLDKRARALQLEAIELQSVERILAQLPEHNLVQSKPDAFLSTAASAFAAR